jgi:hypothetical protein
MSKVLIRTSVFSVDPILPQTEILTQNEESNSLNPLI